MHVQKHMTKTLRRLKVAALVSLSTLAILLASSAYAQTACTLQEYTLPSVDYLQLTYNANGYVVHLQRSSDQYAPTVQVWEQGQYMGAYYIPVAIYDIEVSLEGRYVLETWMGEVRQVYKQVPVARACAETWTGLEPW